MTKKQRSKLIRIIVAAVLTAAIALSPAEGLIAFALYLIPYLIVAYDTLLKAAKNIARGQVFDENFLMAVASLGALAIGLTKTGDFLEAVAVILFYQVGELFESIAVGKSRRNISALMDIRPDYANLEGADGSLERVDPDDVPVGGIIVVRPGEKVPLDGVVLTGTSTLDTGALTGESVPRDVAPGDDIISGCINLSGVLRVQTTKEFGESTVSKILDLVENASSRKSRSEAFISRFARVYTPAVCGAALALAVLPPLVRMLTLGLAPEWSIWIYRALTFLVISCPCALVISIPLSFFAGIGGASRAGILVKGSNYLEALSKTGIVVFDKTGTLTRGSFDVVDVQCANGFTRGDLLEVAACAESGSSHPIAQSLARAWAQAGGAIDRARVDEVREISGRGVCACVDGRPVAVGNLRLMEEQRVAAEPVATVGTVVYVAVDGTFAGAVVIADAPKATSAEAVRDLHEAGIRPVAMLTGDLHPVAEAVGAELGLDRVCDELLPQDKVAKVEELMAEFPGRALAFVGDGINDAPVLSRADIGVAMGALGSDAAIEAADVVLMDDDPKQVGRAIRLARRCMRIVYQNIVFSIGVKVACLGLVALGLAGMWLAIFADVGVMVLCVLNAMRCLRVANP